jgi:ABC-2 type transport system permease protein
MITDKDSIIEMMEKLFPGDVKGSLGIFASDVGVFYTIVIALMCHGLLPGEIRDGKWIIPVNIGISKSKLIGSKCIVYACGIGLPVLVITNLYYYVSATLLNNNLTIETAVLNSVVLCFSVMGIVASTILLSVIYKHSILAALSVILTVMAAPDVLTFFTFGKYFPTYLLTFTYTVSDSIFDLIIPAIVLLLMTGVLFELSLKKLEKIEVVR